jgi:hypothetical protein
MQTASNRRMYRYLPHISCPIPLAGATIASPLIDRFNMLHVLESVGSVVTHLSTMGTTIVKGA